MQELYIAWLKKFFILNLQKMMDIPSHKYIIPHIENAQPAGVISKGYLSDKPPTVFLNIEDPEISINIKLI